MNPENYAIWCAEWLNGKQVSSDWYRDEETDEVIIFPEKAQADKEALELSSEFLSCTVTNYLT